MTRVFPCHSMIKNQPANAGDRGSISWLGGSPGGGNGNSLQYSCLGNSMGREAWQVIAWKWKPLSRVGLCNPMDYRVHGILQARVLEWVAIPFSRGIFPSQGSNPGLLHCKQILYHLSHKGSPSILEWVTFCWGSSQPRNQTRVSCITGKFFTNWATREAQVTVYGLWGCKKVRHDLVTKQQHKICRCPNQISQSE